MTLLFKYYPYNVHNMDTIDAMRTFAAVAKTSSFTKAAERLGLSVKLASKYVGQLEDRLGVRLLNRTTRRISLTEVGAAYLERCQSILDEFDNLEAAVQDKHTTPKGTLLISAPTTFGEMYLTSAITDFLNTQSEIIIKLKLSDRYVDIVDEGFDLAIRVGKLDDSSLIAKRLAPARLVACASPGYLKKSGIPKHPEQLINHTCIIDSNLRDGVQWPFQENDQPFSVKVSGAFHVNSALASRNAAINGAGIVLSPTYVVGRDISAGKLTAVLTEFEPPKLGLYAVYPHNRHLATKIRVFVNFLSKRFSNTPDWDQF